MEQFSITLISNVYNPHHENKVNKFITQLPIRYNLEGNWVVGAKFISYTKSWLPPTSIEYIHLCKFKKNDIFEDFNNFIKIDTELTDDFEDLLNQIQEEITLKNDATLPTITQNSENKVEIKVGKSNGGPSFFMFTPKLARMLGIDYENYKSYVKNVKQLFIDQFSYDFGSKAYKKYPSLVDQIYKPPKIRVQDEIFYSSLPMIISNEYKYLTVNCDIVKPHFVGSSYKQELREVEIPPGSEFRQQIHLDFNEIEYHPVMIKDFESIEINIKNDNDELVPFKSGRSIVKLIFKKE